MSQQLTRRLAMQSLTMGGLVAMAGSKGTGAAAAAESATPLKGNIKHSVCRWCYGRIPLDDLCKAAKAIAHFHTGGVPGRHEIGATLE